MVARNKPTISITVTAETFDHLEEQRGLIPRSRYVELILTEYFAERSGGNP